MQALGIDIGGSAIKAAPVDLETGTLVAERLRLATSGQLSLTEMSAKLFEIVEHFTWQGPVGIGFPSVIRDGVALTTANVSDDWLGVNLRNEFSACCPGPVSVLNDADAAGLAELSFGAGSGCSGTLLLVTIGTGLGTALFREGTLVPNLELGHLVLDGQDAETFASDAARLRDGLSWEAWAERFDRYLAELERLLWPDLIILGGGGSYEFDKFSPFLTTRTRIVPAVLRNDAGIVGAAQATNLL